MIPIKKITGRLGNQMFQFATLYAKAKNEGTDYYFQNPAYFEDCKDEIKQMYGQGITPINRVGIHIRRGDYVNNLFYVDLMTTGYYERAMALFPNEKFIVFSDDIEYCKQQDIFKDCEFSEGKTEIEDMNLMAGCKHQIIANSSFSLWCGILNPNPNKKVICPPETKYYSDGMIRTKYPNYFIQLDFDYEPVIK